VIAIAPGLERVDRAPEERLDDRLRPPAAREYPDDGLHTSVTTQRAVREVDERAARLARLVGETAELARETRSRCYARDDAGRFGKLNRQGCALGH
jgi:hypothetical protein